MFRVAILLPFLLVGCRCAMRPLPVDPKPLLRPEPLAGGVSGTVRLKGEWWPDKAVQQAAGIPRPRLDPAKLETLVLGDGESMANVYVAIKSGLDARKYDGPLEPVVIRQADFVYSPLVSAAMTGQAIEIRNEDASLHNPHFATKLNPEFNVGQPKGGGPILKSFPHPEMAISLKCDVHPWMRGWVHISDHPYYSITGPDGAYSFEGLPAGDYEIVACHPRFDRPLVSRVTLVEGLRSRLDFTFVAPLSADRCLPSACLLVALACLR